MKEGPFEGFELVGVYSRADAIEDGVLVDVIVGVNATAAVLALLMAGMWLGGMLKDWQKGERPRAAAFWWFSWGLVFAAVNVLAILRSLAEGGQ